MTVFDKMIAAVTPPESEEARKEARARARSASKPGDWLSLLLTHHEKIESAFAAVKGASTAAARVAAQKKLAIFLNGHSIAEEAVIYPALTMADEEGHATKAYSEQAAAKTQLALLENLDPFSEDYLDKLEHLRGAVAHHVYEEEGTWFIELKEKIPELDQRRLLSRYEEEYRRYVGADSAHPNPYLQATGGERG